MTNSPVQGDICRSKFEKFGGHVRVMVADFDHLYLADGSFDAIYALESVGYSKDIDAWLARCWRMLKPGGRPIDPFAGVSRFLPPRKGLSKCHGLF